MIVPSEHNEFIIAISPIGFRDTTLLRLISREVHRVFGFKTDIMHNLKDIDFALDIDRSQYHSTLILDKLAGLIPHPGLKILAITTVDLFIPILTHVYGEAQLGGVASIVSTYHLRKDLPTRNDRKSYYQRVVKESIHELGHTFNLRHCRDHTCIMHYCRSLKDVDRKSDQFCRYCMVLLGDEMKRLAKTFP